MSNDGNSSPPDSLSPESPRRAWWVRLAPAAVLLAGLAAAFAFNLQQYLSCSALMAHQVALHVWVAEAGALAVLVFMALYIAVVAFSIPGGALMTMAGAYLFGHLATTAYVVVAATIGATIVFLVARTAVGDLVRNRAGPFMRRMEEGFQRDALSYMLMLRLVPLFPFWACNLAPAFLEVRLRTFVVATFFGIIPGTFVFASVGAGLGSILEADGECDVSDILTTEIVIALLGLAALASIPIVYRALKRRRSAATR